jgi:molecular chaperone DnaK (HSP70)
MATPLAVGLDFGASFSTAAVFSAGRLHFALDARADACIPTAVHFPSKGAPVVGAEAMAMRARCPSDVVFGFKRLLGSTYESPARRFADTVTPLRLRKGPQNDIRIKTMQGEHTPVEVAAIVIGDLKRNLETKLRAKIDRAVVTAPARSSSLARSETIAAARMAGFRSVELLPEPVAAALSFGVGNRQGDRRFLVYDFGGGTFDSTVVVQQGDRFEVEATDGDECLGGDNFDEELAKHLANEMWKVECCDPTKDRVLWDQVVRAAELAKRALSSALDTVVRITEAGTSQPIAIRVARATMELVWQALVERSIATTATTMLAASARPKDLTAMMLVGGTTFMPMIRSRVRDVFQVPCGWSEDAQTAVAAGAALKAGGRLSVSAGWES